MHNHYGYFSQQNLMSNWTHPVSLQPWSGSSMQLTETKLSKIEEEVVDDMIQKENVPADQIHVIRSLKQAVELFGEKESPQQVIDETPLELIEENDGPRQIEVKFAGRPEQIYEYDTEREALACIEVIKNTSQYLDIQYRLVRLVMKKKELVPTWTQIGSYVD